MRRRVSHAFMAVCLAGAVVGATQAQAEAAKPWESACILKYLDPNGDGFLSIRTGPGTQYREIARVRNGDSMPVDMRKCQGKWCFAESAFTNNRRTDLQGWFHTGWCEMIP